MQAKFKTQVLIKFLNKRLPIHLGVPQVLFYYKRAEVAPKTDRSPGKYNSFNLGNRAWSHF